MEVKLSVFELHWVGLIVLSRPPREQSVLQDFSMRYENFDHFFIMCIEKFIDQPETKMTDIDPSIVGQHVWPLKNNFFKACHVILKSYTSTVASSLGGG